MSDFFRWLACLWFGHDYEIAWDDSEFLGWTGIKCLRCGKESRP